MVRNPGRRCALPRADLFGPFGAEEPAAAVQGCPRLIKSWSRPGKWVSLSGAGNGFMNAGLERTLEPRRIPVWMVSRLSSRITMSPE